MSDAIEQLRAVPTDYDDLIRRAAENHLPEHYPWQWYRAQLIVESALDPSARSPTGASGIAQFMPQTWQHWGDEGTDPRDPAPAIDTGARYMAWLISQWSWPRPAHDRWCLAMVCYNAGLGHILDAQRESGDASLYAPIMGALPEVTSREKSDQALHYAPRILDIASAHVLYGRSGQHAPLGG